MTASTGTLVILRHGESTWNQENLFTGWHDVPLSAKGEGEAANAGHVMAEAGLWFDLGHTSLLTRAADDSAEHPRHDRATSGWRPTSCRPRSA